MKSHATEGFWKAFRALPAEVQDRAKSAYRQWKANPAHPSVRFKRIHSERALYSVRIGIGYRAFGVRDGETMIRFWIGSHADYDKLARRS